MIRKLVATVLLGILPFQSQANNCGTVDLIAEVTPEERARLDELIAPHPYPNGNLFLATKGEDTALIVGTLHIPDPRLEPIIDTARPYIEDADLLILEATAEDEAGIQTLAASRPEMFFITECPTMIDVLTPEEWDQVTERLQAIGIPGFLAAKFQPWYLTLTLAVPPCAMELLQSGEKGLDRQLEAIAVDAGVPLAALDDMETVLKIFSDEPIEKQLDGLRVTLETQQDGNASTSTLMQGYFEGRIRETWEFARILLARSDIENGEEMFEEVNQQLLINRNADWETKLPDLIIGRDVVIAVGAAHLSGESGVVRALERAGYTISQP